MYGPMLLRAPQSFHTHTYRYLHIRIHSVLPLLPSMLILSCFLWGCCLRVCVWAYLSRSPPFCVWVLTLTFVLCGLSFTLHTPQWHQSPRIFYHLFSQVSVFIVWTLCVALQWLLNGRSCLVHRSPLYTLFSSH